ncbi:hypothetical protein AUR04nite_11000 [Glutamicibacter uratoxydans]|uniref:Uncharacterized protein n=1 Tax=Glutamicibacter uratoxydans TaxID=43667 RepID=A0A4Y4DQB8_GLUUR|nr:hypothetical protein AUR04nite_11000 [Glutamicibacter uratoxydans]
MLLAVHHLNRIAKARLAGGRSLRSPRAAKLPQLKVLLLGWRGSRDFAPAASLFIFKKIDVLKDISQGTGLVPMKWQNKRPTAAGLRLAWGVMETGAALAS